MIKVNIVKKQGLYESITINGHAMYDDFGKDIVCSAASSIVTTSINSIIALDKDGLKYEVASGDVSITNIKNDTTITKLLNVLENMLEELAKDYPENIKISKED